MKDVFRDFNELNEKEQGKLLKGSIIPRPIAWITTLNGEGLVNLAPFSYFNMISSSLVMVSFQRLNNKKKDTANNILKTKEAVINIATESLIEQVDNSSEHISSNISELTLVNVETIKSKLIKTPGILDSPIRLETKLVEHVELKSYDNINIEADLIILRVVGGSFNKEVIDEKNNYILFDKLKPLSRLGGPNYAKSEVVKDYNRKF